VAQLTLETANRLIATIFDEARRRDLPPIAAAVLDSGGHLKAMQRQDGLSFLRAGICQAKAWGSLALGTESRDLAERFASDLLQRGFMQALNAMSDGRIIPLPGGVRLFGPDGQVIGAVGVAGAASDQDEACALAAIERLGLERSDGDD
jgi:uncharacterized protein GlcG (DUF336 family)